MKLKDIYHLFDSPLIITDNDGHDYTAEEARDMEVISLQHSLHWIIVIVEP